MKTKILITFISSILVGLAVLFGFAKWQESRNQILEVEYDPPVIYNLEQVKPQIVEVANMELIPVVYKKISVVTARDKGAQHIVSVRKQYHKEPSVKSAYYLYDRIAYWAKEYDIPVIYALILVNVESDFEPSAKVKRTKAYGLCQITPVCLKDFNNKTGNKYTMSEMLDIEKNLEVGMWYMNRLLTVYGKNFGIYNFKDAYLAYNVGPKEFHRGRHSYRVGVLPHNSPYGKANSKYVVADRYVVIEKRLLALK